MEKPKKLYALALSAKHLVGTNIVAMSVRLDADQDVRAYAMQCCKETYPPSEGYYSHMVSIAETPKEWYV